MNETVSWIEHAMRLFNGFLMDPTPLRAVVFGLLLSWIGTQALKFMPAVQKMADDDHRLGVRLLAFWLAAWPVVWMWPGAWPDRLFAAVITGGASPTAYTLLVRSLYHFFPWLEPRLSAKPGADRGPR